MKPMTDSLRRINRAKKHLNVLNREIKAFIASQPYRCTINKDPKDGCYIIQPYLIKGEYPIPWGFLTGEVAHGLRSALDNIAWSLAIKRDTKTCFPIFIKRNTEFIKRLERLRNDIRADVEAVQPYNRPNGQERSHPLWILNNIDIIDKHRIILPCVARITIPSGLPSPIIYFFIYAIPRLDKGDVIFKLPPYFNNKKDFKPEIVAQIGFDISTINSKDPLRLRLNDLFSIHHFVRYDVYPRFAKFL